ncbi:MAG TPA: M28 family peptidase [Vicinamibacterales bacterium]|nr:M28 family peptidase [Vicinamibacterales bacterium]
MKLRIRAAALCLALAVCLPLRGSAQASRISQDDLKQWLTYIASDDLQGRQVFTEGLALAGTYIADHLKQWNVRPGGDNGGYFQVVKVLGVHTDSRSSVDVTVNGQTRTFKDGEGVTFPRNQGSKQSITAKLDFVGYGITYSPLELDDYSGHDMHGKIAIYIGRRAPGMTATEDRLVNARGRFAVETEHASGAIGPAQQQPQGGGGAQGPAAGRGRGGNSPQRVDFTTVQRLDTPLAPAFTAGDDFYRFVFSASGQNYDDLKTRAGRQEALPRVNLENVSIRVNIDADYDVVQTRLTRNVVGIVEGTDARLRDTYVLLGAHYDHVGYQQFAGTVAAPESAIALCQGQHRPTPRPDDIINNGADDDGSGTVSLMAIAKAFATGQKPKRSLVFVWHAGEEAGLYGSRYMADYPVVPLDHVAAQLNIDMVGRNECDDATKANTLFLVGSDRISTELHNINEDANAALPMPLTLDYALNDIADTESLYTRSDHYSYASKGIPIIFFTTGLHKDYHYVTDEVDKIIFPKMTRIAQLVYTTANRLANLDHFPERDNKGPRMGRGETGKIAR